MFLLKLATRLAMLPIGWAILIAWAYQSMESQRQWERRGK